jgi:glycosyltransferase involved in cell wall biosynthesis
MGPLMPTRVCMFGHFSPTYPRNRQVQAALGALGHDVVQIQRDGPVLRRWPRLARAARARRFDVVWVAFLGYSDVPLAWLISRWRKVPLVFDAFILLHDTFVTDRATVRRRSPAALFLRVLEIVACHLADVVVVDTLDHAERVAQRTHLAAERIRVLHVGSDQKSPCPPHTPNSQANGPTSGTTNGPTNGSSFTVAFCGSFMPLHGTDVIVHAARLLDDRADIRFLLVGDGQTKAEAVRLARTLGCRHVSFLEARRGDALRDVLCHADVLLGVFGDSEKTRVVVPNKVVDALALAKPLITADTPAIRRMLDGTRLRTVPPRDARALADAVLDLCSDASTRARLGRAGREAYEELFSPAALQGELAEILRAAAH